MFPHLAPHLTSGAPCEGSLRGLLAFMAECGRHGIADDGEKEKNALMVSRRGVANKLPYSYYNKNCATIASRVFKEF